MISPRKRRPGGGFTLLEILTVIVVISILVVLSFPVVSGVRSRMERVNCTNNLRQLYVAASNYLQQNGRWPQVSAALQQQPHHAYDEAWIEAYLPFGASREIWICPTIQHSMGSPDITKSENYRADYMVMPFDNKPDTPHRWPDQPWFVERGNMHGSGNLLILTNGSVTDLNSVRPSSSFGQ